MKPNPLEPRFRTLIGYLTGKEDNTLEDILIEVSRKSKIDIDLIKADTRKIESFKGKYFYYRRAIEIQYNSKTKYTLNKIGAIVGRDHASIINAMKRGNKLYSSEYLKMFRPGKGIMVKMFKNDRYIRTFRSVREVTVKTGFPRYAIRRSLLYGWNTKGFTFQYAQ